VTVSVSKVPVRDSEKRFQSASPTFDSKLVKDNMRLQSIRYNVPDEPSQGLLALVSRCACPAMVGC
jgi:hypothetical protein